MCLSSSKAKDVSVGMADRGFGLSDFVLPTLIFSPEYYSLLLHMTIPLIKDVPFS